MLPELARRAINSYSDPGDLVFDPLCGIGTTLVEAIHLGRDAIGIELEPRWAKLARANITLAERQGARGHALVLDGDARQAQRLLARRAQSVLAGERGVARLPAGRVDLVLTSPPYACEVGEPDKQAWDRGGNLCNQQTRNYTKNRDNLGYARGERYRSELADIYRACATLLRPGGYLVLVTKNMRSGGRFHDLAHENAAVCAEVGLVYWQHVIALLAAVRDGQLVPRPSFWQLLNLRRMAARGEPAQLVCHEDVVAFRLPPSEAALARARQARAAA